MSSVDELSGLLDNTEARLSEAVGTVNAAKETAEQLFGVFQRADDEGSAQRTRTVIDGIETVLNTIVGVETDVADLRGQVQGIKS